MDVNAYIAGLINCPERLLPYAEAWPVFRPKPAIIHPGAGRLGEPEAPAQDSPAGSAGPRWCEDDAHARGVMTG